MSLRRVFIYLLRPRWHRKSFRTATRYPAPTTPEQPDFAHGKFLVFCNLQPTKSACSAATGNGLSGVGQPLSSVSGRKRYNTLDFASKIVCQVELRPLWIPLPRATLFPFGYPMPTGMLLAPIGNPEPKGRQCPPLESSRIFYCCGYPNCQNAVRHPCSENTKTLQISSSNLMKPVAFYYSALISILREFVRYVAASTLQFSGYASVFWQ